MRALPLLCVAVSGLQPSTRRQFVAGTTSTALAPAAAMARDLQFKDLGDGLTVAQITEGRGDAAVRQDSIVLVELVGASWASRDGPSRTRARTGILTGCSSAKVWLSRVSSARWWGRAWARCGGRSCPRSSRTSTA